MKAIVCVDEKWGIGIGADLLVRIPEDMKFFKNKTMGNVIVAGRKTIEGFPGGQALPGRINIMLTRNRELKLDNVISVHSREELYQKLADYADITVLVVGGGQIYSMLLKDCDEVYVTKVFDDFGADVFFENLDLHGDFQLIEQTETKQYDKYSYCFCRYTKMGDYNDR